jgi:hypothetical protein
LSSASARRAASPINLFFSADRRCGPLLGMLGSLPCRTWLPALSS